MAVSRTLAAAFLAGLKNLVDHEWKAHAAENHSCLRRLSLVSRWLAVLEQSFGGRGRTKVTQDQALAWVLNTQSNLKGISAELFEPLPELLVTTLVDFGGGHQNFSCDSLPSSFFGSVLPILEFSFGKEPMGRLAEKLRAFLSEPSTVNAAADDCGLLDLQKLHAGFIRYLVGENSSSLLEDCNCSFFPLLSTAAGSLLRAIRKEWLSRSEVNFRNADSVPSKVAKKILDATVSRLTELQDCPGIVLGTTTPERIGESEPFRMLVTFALFDISPNLQDQPHGVILSCWAALIRDALIPMEETSRWNAIMCKLDDIVKHCFVDQYVTKGSFEAPKAGRLVEAANVEAVDFVVRFIWSVSSRYCDVLDSIQSDREFASFLPIEEVDDQIGVPLDDGYRSTSPGMGLDTDLFGISGLDHRTSPGQPRRSQWESLAWEDYAYDFPADNYDFEFESSDRRRQRNPTVFERDIPRVTGHGKSVTEERALEDDGVDQDNGVATGDARDPVDSTGPWCTCCNYF